MTYKVALLGRVLENEWNPMEQSLFDFIKTKMQFKRELHELDAIFSKDTGMVHVSVRSGHGA